MNKSVSISIRIDKQLAAKMQNVSKIIPIDKSKMAVIGLDSFCELMFFIDNILKEENVVIRGKRVTIRDINYWLKEGSVNFLFHKNLREVFQTMFLSLSGELSRMNHQQKVSDLDNLSEVEI